MTSVRPVDNHLIEDAAARLADAERAGAPCTPVRDLIGRTDIDTAYRVQTRNVDAAVAAGLIGGFGTSEASKTCVENLCRKP
ncbi:hypothetical protein [Rhodococcus sp. WB9]|uniref:hypothetical protein n=1 Tax=Rhodococcus sp. WB9 TaxID=2594007 RepID=UPI0021B44630|nr:hypothetical protein [Rhodococcus sp. WB9]